MELNDPQKDAVKQWVREGAGLSEVQQKLSSEFDVSMTYMDVRFLILDLGIELKDAEPSRPEKTTSADLAASPADVPGESSAEASLPPDPSMLGGVSLEISRIAQPGALVSGTVTFSDGVSASWSLDQMGRLALSAQQEGYSPSEQDIKSFQEELKKALETKGF